MQKQNQAGTPLADIPGEGGIRPGNHQVIVKTNTPAGKKRQPEQPDSGRNEDRCQPWPDPPGNFHTIPLSNEPVLKNRISCGNDITSRILPQ